MDRTLTGKVSIVTGAGPGIGRSTALALARDGADLLLVARRDEPLQALAVEVAAATGRRVEALAADVGDRARGAEIVACAVERLGRLDGLVNVASAPAPRAPVTDMDWDGYLETMQFAAAATMHLCARAAERMAEHGDGAIVNIGALSSTTLIPKLSRYTSSKAAMVALSKTMAKEIGALGVRVNVVTPGFTTGAPLDAMFEDMARRGGGDARELSARAAREAALHRHVDPEDIAEAVLFLLSGRGRNVTGVELHVTAGQWIGA